MKPKTGPELHSKTRVGPPVSTSDEGSQPIGQFYEGCFKCAAEMNEEAANFVRHRIEEDMKLPQKLAKCQSPIDIYNTQVGFYMQMVDDYFREGQKVLEMARTITMNNEMANGTSNSSSKSANDID